MSSFLIKRRALAAAGIDACALVFTILDVPATAGIDACAPVFPILAAGSIDACATIF